MDELTKTPPLVPLADATLDQLDARIARPTYDRTGLTPGIVHIGLGNFHRAHQSWYLHRLMQMGEALDWAIIGAGVRPNDAQQRDRLAAQDYLTTLIELDPDGTSAEVVGPMVDFLPVEPDNAALIARMSQPDIRIVALTVTEGGYYIDPATGAFDVDHPDIQYDAGHPDQPRTAFGAMIAAYAARRAAGIAPFTGQCCDNLQSNGDVLRRTVVSLARLSDPDLADWIDREASFPNAMVDCIVPATGPREAALVASFGIADAAPVSHESFRQWVMEDDFCAGRPDWDRVGAQFSDDVHGYELQKIRILNAGHQIIANPAEILHIDTISGAMAHPGIRALFRKVAGEEIVPHIVPVPGMTPTEYVDLIERRFANPAIVDTTRRVAFDGSSRHSGFVLPTLREALGAGAALSGLALVEAAWARMCEGTREDGSRIDPNDPAWDLLTARAATARDDPSHWLGMTQFYGDLAQAEPFAQAFDHWLRLIWSDGIEAAINAYLES